MSSDRRVPFELAGPSDSVAGLNGLIRKAELIAEKDFEKTRPLESICRVAEQVLALADGKIKEITLDIDRVASLEPSSRIQCKEACCHCCYRVPELTITELAGLWSFVATDFSEGEKSALRVRVARYLEDTAPFRPNSLVQARSACPLLVDGKCSAYVVRPLSCRALNSRSVAACEKIRMGAPATSRPAWPQPFHSLAAIRMGARIGQFFEGLGYETLDLGHALSVLFENQDAVRDYLEGKDRFLTSRSAYETEAFDAEKIAGSTGPAYLSKQESDFPSGNLPAEDSRFLGRHTNEYLETGDFPQYLQGLHGKEVQLAMARINVPRVAMSEEEIDETRNAYVAAIREFENSNYPPKPAFNALSFHQTMNLTYQGRNDLDILREHGCFVVDQISARALPTLSGPREGKRKPGKLRVGFISGHLNRSNNGRWAWPWVKHLSDEIETFCFMVGTHVDGYTDLFRTYADHFYWLKRSVPQNAAFIRGCDLDALIFTDIGIYARITQYSSLKLAPVQCAAWGGPETSGLPTLDYYLSAEYMEAEDAEQHYTEKLVRLPRSGMLFYRENFDTPPMDRAYFGLPETGPLLLMAQTCMKLTPKHDHLFARISEKARTEIVFLESDPPGDSTVVKRRLQRAGVRARWLRRLTGTEYLGLLKIADVSIDPPMWSGGNTTVQALTVGTPVVTLPGPYMRSRHSLAFLRQANAYDLAAKDEHDFVNLACDFERQKQALKSLEAGALYGDIGVIRALDEFLFSTVGV